MSELTPQQAQTLLEKLSNDDAFRAALSTNPEAALKDAGLPATLADCVS
jgi:putative modified peptide